MHTANFSGTWRYRREKSNLEIPPPDSAVFVIHHAEPHFHLQRTLTAGGKSDTFSIDLTTDGHQVSTRHRDLLVQSRLFWEEDSLVFNSDIARGDEKGTNNVRYKLVEDGKAILAIEHLTSPNLTYSNKWVLVKEEGPGPESHE